MITFHKVQAPRGFVGCSYDGCQSTPTSAIADDGLWQGALSCDDESHAAAIIATLTHLSKQHPGVDMARALAAIDAG